MARNRMGRTPAHLARNAAQMEALAERAWTEESRAFFRAWARVRTQIALLPEGAERDALLEQLGAMQDSFYDRIG